MIRAGVSAAVSTVKVSSPHIGSSFRLMPYNTHCRTTNTSKVRTRYLRATSAVEENRRPSGLTLEAKRLPIECRNLPIYPLPKSWRSQSIAGSAGHRNPQSLRRVYRLLVNNTPIDI